MLTRTISSDRARNNWGEIIEAALAGEVVDIERYGRSVAVVISRKMFERLQASHLAMLGYISREAARTGNEISFAPGEAITPEAIESKARALGWELPEAS